MSNESTQLDYSAIGQKYVQVVDSKLTTGCRVDIGLRLEGMSLLEAIEIRDLAESNPLAVDPAWIALIVNKFGDGLRPEFSLAQFRAKHWR